jgi:membrane-anchored glycerophosphoryl diester phosphodiesterase (GDPDase)
LLAIIGFLAGGEPTTTTIITVVLLTLVGILLFIFIITWLLSRLLITECPLAIEENINATTAISRSWQLTKGSVFRLQLIVFVAFLISLPISIIVQIASAIIQGLLGAIFPADSGILIFLLVLAIAAISISSGALMIPFWQAIKAVIYYDLRVRREGFDMEIG